MNYTMILFAWFCLWPVGTQNHVQRLDSIVVRYLHSWAVELDSSFNIFAVKPIKIESIDTTWNRMRRLREISAPFEYSSFYEYYYTHGTAELIEYGYCGKNGVGVPVRRARILRSACPGAGMRDRGSNGSPDPASDPGHFHGYHGQVPPGAFLSRPEEDPAGRSQLNEQRAEIP